MSNQAANAFLDKLENDTELRSAMRASGGGGERIALTTQQLCELGAQRGFDFSAQEIFETGTKRGVFKRAQRDGELSENQLEHVAGGSLVTESLSLNFSKMEIEYVEYKTGGSGTPDRFGWDLKKAKG